MQMALFLLVPQQPVLFTLCIITTVIAYIQPYRSIFANIIEVILSVNTILLFLVSITKSFETHETGHNRTYTIECATSEDKSSTYHTSYVFYFQTLFYFFTFAITVVIMIVLVVYITW